MNRLLIRVLSLSLASLGAAAERPPALTLNDAREIALRKHPKISVAELKALAAKQLVRQAQSAYYPTVSANLGAAVSDSDHTRIVANPLTVSSALDRASGSLTVTQIITDFGRTSHLTESARLKAAAEARNIEATRAQVILQVDGAYVGALQAGSLLRVAEGTVKTRQLLRDQIATLAKNKLKSDLDASFAEVGLQEALLLFSKSENDLLSAYTTLGALLDEPETPVFRLADSPAPPALPADVTGLIALAMNDRPDLQRLRLEQSSTQEFAWAESALSRPTLSAQGTAGVLPWRDQSLSQNYAAAGIVLSWPLFSGGLNTARKKEADLRAKVSGASLRDEENNAARDVRLA